MASRNACVSQLLKPLVANCANWAHVVSYVECDGISGAAHRGARGAAPPLHVSVKCIIYDKISIKIVLRCLKLLISHVFPAWGAGIFAH